MVRSIATQAEAGLELALRRMRLEGALPQIQEEAVRSLAAGARVLHAGERLAAPGGDGVALLLEGWACKRWAAGCERPQIFAFVLPGDPMGTLPGCVPEREVEVRALGQAVWVDAAPLLARDADGRPQHPHIVAALESLGRRAEGRLIDHVQRLSSPGAREALGHLLLELYGRHEEVGAATGPRFPFPVDRRCLAESLAISDLHLNRLMADLGRRGRLLRGRGWLCLPRLHDLAEEVAYRGPLP